MFYGVVALILFISVILTMAFLTLAERRVIGSMQVRIGPNRVGPGGLLQPFADVLKLMLKEIVIPSSSSKFLFIIAPLLARDPGARRLGGGAAVAGLRGRRHQRRLVVSARAELRGRVRRDPRRLGDELEVRVPGRDARARRRWSRMKSRWASRWSAS